MHCMDSAATLQLPASLQGVNFAAVKPKDAIQKVRYSHAAMIDMIVANPWISQGELAANFGYTEGWVSQVIASDAFQAALAKRKDELVDPTLRATIEERFKGLVARSLDILMKKLEKPVEGISDELALKAMEIASKALGYGQKNPQINMQNNFVVQVPAKAASSADWAAAHGAGGKLVASPPAFKGPKEAEDAVLVDPGITAPTKSLGASLLAELKEVK